MATDMIRFYCVGCGRRNKAPRDYAGKNSRCPACKTINRIPEAAGTSTPTPQFRARKTLSTPITPEGIVDAGASIIADIGDFLDQPAPQQDNVQQFLQQAPVDTEAVERRQKYESLSFEEEDTIAPSDARQRFTAPKKEAAPAPTAPAAGERQSDIQIEAPQKKITLDLVLALVGAIALGALVTWFIISMTST